MSRNRFALLGLFVAFTAACSSSSSSDTPAQDATVDSGVDTYLPLHDAVVDTAEPADTAEVATDAFAGCTRDPGAPTPDAGTGVDASGNPVDPAGFTVDMAMQGFPTPRTGTITAVITTELGAIVCQLDEAHAPITTANFIGLARGTRPAQRASTSWTYSHFYDGLKWHRVIPDFVIQGGDPEGTGGGGPGYDLPNENHVPEPTGALAMAASTAPSGSQFYIVVGSGPAANYNVFGTCTTDVGTLIANVPRDSADMPKTPVHMITVEIALCPSK